MRNKKLLIANTIGAKKMRAGFFFTLPALLFFLFFFFYPILTAFFTSFTSWDLVNPRKFIGLSNYIKLFTDERFLHSLYITIYFTIVAGFITLIISFILALMIDTGIKFGNIFKAAYFLPTIISLAVISVIFRYMYNPQGLITVVIKEVFGVSIPWQSSYQWAMPSVIIMFVWNRVGFFLVIYYAGLQSIPVELYDSAKIDGANYPNLLFRIIIPLMNPILLLSSIIMVTQYFRQFVPFFMLTEGGPGYETTVITLKIYRDGLESLLMGQASAESIITVIILFAFTVVYLKIFGKETEY